MTVKLGWPHALIGLVILGVFSFAVWRMVKTIREQSVVDADRIREIDRLQDEVDSLTDQAETWHEKADELRGERDKGATALMDLKKRLAQLLDEPAPTPEIEDEQRVVCLRYVVLLEDQLKLADQETLALRKELDVTRLALDYTLQRYELQTQRLGASQRQAKRTRRRSVWTITSVSAATALLGFGIGRI